MSDTENEKIPQYVEYLRVSSAGKDKSNTIHTQRAVLDAYALRCPGVRVGVHQDVGISGAKGATERPGLRALISQVGAGGVDEVRVYAIDRLTRAEALSDQYTILDALTAVGVTIVEVSTGRVNTRSNEGDEMIMALSGLFARAERRKITQRTVHGRRRALDNNRPASTGLPYGLRHNREQGWSYQAAEAEVVKRIFALATTSVPGQLGGMSLGSIARALNADGVPPPRAGQGWGETTIGRIVRQTAYVGRLVQKVPLSKEWRTLNVPPLVDEATWSAAQLGVAARRNQPRRSRYAVPALLRGLIRCGKCDGAIIVKANKPAKGGDRYRCQRCQEIINPSVSRLDNLVWEDLSARIKGSDSLLSEAAASDPAGEAPCAESELADAEAKLVKLRRKKQALAARFAVAENEDEAVYYDTQAALTSHQRTLVSQIEDLRVEMGRRNAMAARRSDVVASLDDLRDRMDGADWVQRREVVVALLDPAFGGGAVMHPDGRVDLRVVVGLAQSSDGTGLMATGESPSSYSHSASVGRR